MPMPKSIAKQVVKPDQDSLIFVDLRQLSEYMRHMLVTRYLTIDVPIYQGFGTGFNESKTIDVTTHVQLDDDLGVLLNFWR